LSKEDNLVAVYRATNKEKAQAIKSLLESKDIPCQLEPMKLWLSPGSSLVNRGEVNVLVQDSQADSARKLLKRRKYV
jgi:hypothetical protein